MIFSRIKTRYLAARKLLNMADMKGWGFLLSALLLGIKALISGVALALLVPVAESILSHSFTLRPVLWILFLTVLKAAIEFAASAVLAQQAEWLTYRIRCRLFDSLIHRKKTFYDRSNIGSLSGVLGFCDKIPRLASMASQLLNRLLTLIVYAGVMLYVSWKFALVVLLIFPVLYLTLSKTVRNIQSGAFLVKELLLDVARRAHNILSAIEMVQSFNKQSHESKRYAKLSSKLRGLRLSVALKRAAVAPAQEIIGICIVLAIFTCVGMLVMKSQIAQVSGLLVFVYLLKSALPIFNRLNEDRASMAQLYPSLDAILELLNAGEVRQDQELKQLDTLRDRIVFKGLKFSYRSDDVIKDVSFEVRKGEKLAIVGESGSGKSTLAKLLLRIYEPPFGSIFFDKTDICEADTGSLREHITYIGQDCRLLEGTLRDNIAYAAPKRVTDDALKRVVEHACLTDLIESSPQGLDTPIGEGGMLLSGGEKQRIALARAFLRQGEVIIFDEATSALDAETERRLKLSLDDLIREKTAVIITHRLNTIKDADRILVLEEGRIIQTGTFDELIKCEGPVKKYWNEQAGSLL